MSSCNCKPEAELVLDKQHFNQQLHILPMRENASLRAPDSG
jgi:hypothetical protein